MHFDSTITNPNQIQTDCLVIAVFSGQQLSSSAKKIDKATQGYLTRILDTGDFQGKIAETLLLPEIEAVAAKRILLVGCGAPQELTEANYEKIITVVANKLKTLNGQHACLFLTELNIPKHDLTWKIRYATQLIASVFYIFDQFKSNPEDKPRLNSISFALAADKDQKTATKAIHIAEAIISGINLTRDLGNTPGNVCTPTFLAEQSESLAKHYKKLQVTVLDEARMRELGMNTLLAVSQGSQEPAKLITLEYAGAKKKDRPVVLVGKGITFDTGGIWLKPPEHMDEMKFDMSGAGTVLGVIKAICAMNLPINVVGVIACAENMISGSAIKPGDIVTSLSGQTVEIINTDAEGRLVLCDALTYSERFKPEIVIDIATLTGAIVVALGPYAAGLYSNDAGLRNDLLRASQQSQDFLWPMPIIDEYQTRLDSNFADMMNVPGDRVAGSILAACFLARFTKNFTWAHLDIAAVANKSGKEKGATGRPVPLLVQYLLNRVKI